MKIKEVAALAREMGGVMLVSEIYQGTTVRQWLPMFFTVAHKECAVFGTTDGVKNNACGAWTKRTEPPAL